MPFLPPNQQRQSTEGLFAPIHVSPISCRSSLNAVRQVFDGLPGLRLPFWGISDTVFYRLVVLVGTAPKQQCQSTEGNWGISDTVFYRPVVLVGTAPKQQCQSTEGNWGISDTVFYRLVVLVGTAPKQQCQSSHETQDVCKMPYEVRTVLSSDCWSYCALPLWYPVVYFHM